MAWFRAHGAADREQVIERQVTAMGVDRYTVGVHDRAEDRMWRLTNLTATQVLEHARAFAGLNVRGRDIYIGPVQNGGLVLIDDLAAATLDRLRASGLAPAVVVETSPANHQAWIRVAPDALPRELATAVARELAVRYGGDRGSVGADHLGRLAAYTNQKPGRTLPDGRHPWVRLIAAEGRLAPAGKDLVEQVQARLAEERRLLPAAPQAAGSVEAERAWAMLGRQPLDGEARGLPLTQTYLAQEFAVRVGQVLANQQARGLRPDYSAADWGALHQLADRYPWLSHADLAGAMRLGSPGIEQRHRGNVADYVGRTVVNAVRRQQELRAPHQSMTARPGSGEPRAGGVRDGR